MSSSDVRKELIESLSACWRLCESLLRLTESQAQELASLKARMQDRQDEAKLLATGNGKDSSRPDSRAIA